MAQRRTATAPYPVRSLSDFADAPQKPILPNVSFQRNRTMTVRVSLVAARAPALAANETAARRAPTQSEDAVRGFHLSECRHEPPRLDIPRTAVSFRGESLRRCWTHSPLARTIWS